MCVNTINNVTKRHMPAEREKQEAAVFDSAVILGTGVERLTQQLTAEG